MSEEGVNSPSSASSSFSMGASPQQRLGTRVRSPNRRYLVDLGYDNVSSSGGRRQRGSRGAGGAADPISLDLSSSSIGNGEGEVSSRSGASATQRGGLADGGKRATRGGLAASERLEGRRSKRSKRGRYEEEEEEEEEEHGGERGDNDADYDKEGEGDVDDDGDAEEKGARDKAAGKRRKGDREGGRAKRQNRLCSRPGEWQAVHQAVQVFCPWGVRGRQELRQSWTNVADRLKKPQDVQVYKNGEAKYVAVDYCKGRDPSECQDSEQLGVKLQRIWRERANKLEKKEKADEKKTGEGTMTADEANTLEQEDSEEYHLMLALQYQNAAKEQRKDDAEIPKALKKQALDARDKAAGIGGSARNGADSGERGGREELSDRRRRTQGGGRGGAASGRGARAGERGASAGGQRSVAGGRSLDSRASSRGSASSDRGSRRQSRGQSHHSRSSGVLQDWEVDEYFNGPRGQRQERAPRSSGGGGAGGSRSDEPLTVEDGDASEAESVDEADDEAQALSAGGLGRQTRQAKRGGGATRRQVFRGNPGGDAGDLKDSVRMAVNIMAERYANPGGGSVSDPRVTELQAGLQRTNEGLAATTKVALKGLDVAKRTMETVGLIAERLNGGPQPALPAPHVPPAFPYWHGGGGFGGVGHPLPHGHIPQGGLAGGGGGPSQSSTAAVRISPPLPSFSGAGVGGAGPAAAGWTGASAAGGDSGSTGVTGAAATGGGVAGAGAAGAGRRGAGEAGEGAAGTATVGPGVARAGPAAAVAPSTSGKALPDRQTTVVGGAVPTTEVHGHPEGSREGRISSQDTGGQRAGGQRAGEKQRSTVSTTRVAGGRASGGGRAVGVRPPTFTNPRPWRP